MKLNLSEKILEKIEDKKIKPVAKWEFLVKEYAIWFGFIFSIILGVLAVSLSLLILSVSNLDLVQYMPGSTSSFYLSHIPFPLLWFLIFIIFILLAEFSFKHTKRAYKFTLIQIIVVNLIATLFLGFAVNAMGISRKLDRVAVDNLPMYETFGMRRQIEFWTQSEKGFLAGEVQSIQATNKFKLEDLHGQNWDIVLVQDLGEQPVLKRGDLVKLLGEVENESVFKANHLRLWEANLRGHHRMNMEHKPMHPRFERNY